MNYNFIQRKPSVPVWPLGFCAFKSAGPVPWIHSTMEIYCETGFFWYVILRLSLSRQWMILCNIVGNRGWEKKVSGIKRYAVTLQETADGGAHCMWRWNKEDLSFTKATSGSGVKLENRKWLLNRTASPFRIHKECLVDFCGLHVDFSDFFFNPTYDRRMNSSLPMLIHKTDSNETLRWSSGRW